MTEEEDKRVSQRRYTLDRRSSERRKQYWKNMITPILVGIMATSVVSWGVYVTHLSYSLNAKYEQVFIKYMKDEGLKEKVRTHRMEMMNKDFNEKMKLLHDDIASELSDTRSAIRDLYNLLLRQRPTSAILTEDEE